MFLLPWNLKLAPKNPQNHSLKLKSHLQFIFSILFLPIHASLVALHCKLFFHLATLFFRGHHPLKRSFIQQIIPLNKVKIWREKILLIFHNILIIEYWLTALNYTKCESVWKNKDDVELRYSQQNQFVEKFPILILFCNYIFRHV